MAAAIPARLKALVASVRHSYTLPPITLKLQDRPMDLFGYIERTKRGYRIVLARDSAAAMYHTLLHELAHAIHWHRIESGLACDERVHGDEFFAVYGALYRAHIEP